MSRRLIRYSNRRFYVLIMHLFEFRVNRIIFLVFYILVVLFIRLAFHSRRYSNLFPGRLKLKKVILKPLRIKLARLSHHHLLISRFRQLNYLVKVFPKRN